MSRRADGRRKQSLLLQAGQLPGRPLSLQATGREQSGRKGWASSPVCWEEGGRMGSVARPRSTATDARAD
jgi:hypothetical protein